MKFLKMIPIFFIFLGIPTYMNFSYAESKNPNEYKVLSSTNKKLSISDVKDYIDEGDKFVKDGDFEKAKKAYDKARNLAKQLAGFYRDLNGSFKGLDARIPLEMDKKGRKSIKIWAQSNARLASLYKRKEQPEVAVPLLVEIIRLMTPNSTEGKEAYENLLQLGFVETTYKGF
ncbi:hypothetical protein [Prochlorococcus marinus]|nr:hypothetical protein [Prochlorococcus marinus]KGG05875.1 hypothetical protein EV00_0718 [Prochlorococcus marinus str. MIT 9322]